MSESERASEAIAEMNSSQGLAFHKDQASGNVNGIPMSVLKNLTDPKNEGTLVNLPLKYLSEGENIRKEIPDDDEFRALVESIKEAGLIQYPTIAYKKGKIVLLAGNRRVKAIKVLGWEKVRCVVKIIDSEKDSLHIQLAENINRSSLKPLDYSEAVARLKRESGYTNEKLGNLLGRSRKYIEQLVKIAEWDDEAKSLIEKHDIEITSLIKIAFKKEAKNPDFVRAEILKLPLASRTELFEDTEVENSKKRNERKQREHRNLVNSMSKMKQKKLKEWVSAKKVDSTTERLILEFLRDMKIRGWFSDETVNLPGAMVNHLPLDQRSEMIDV